MTDRKDGWKWFAGTNDEYFSIGPHETRDEAIETARQDACGEFQDEDGVWKVGVHVVEARQDPLRLSIFIDVDHMLERAEEDVSESEFVNYDYGDDGPFFSATQDQEADLAARIKRVCDEWQDAHGLAYVPRAFSASRNHDYVVVRHPNDDRTAT